MNSGSVITSFGKSDLRRGNVVEIEGKTYKVLAVKSETTLTLGPLRWWQRAGYRAIWFVRSMWQRILYWALTARAIFGAK